MSEEPKFNNYKEKQRYFDEKFKNRGEDLCKQPLGSVKYENGKFVRKFKGITLYKVKDYKKGDKYGTIDNNI